MKRIFELLGRIDYRYFKEYGIFFGLKYYFYYATKQYKKKNLLVKDFLVKNFNQDLIQYRHTELEKKKNRRFLSKKDFKIWVFWWQGEDRMPRIVKDCICNLNEKSGNIDVCLITKENFSQYITLPDFIMDKFHKKYFSVTHLSDIVRFYLLYNYGGLWIDATVWVAKDISTYPLCFSSSFFTCKLTKDGDVKSKFIAADRWTGFIMGTNEYKNIIFEYGFNMFLSFWKKYDVLIDYFFIDHIINLLYENNTIIKDLIDEVPINNIEIFMLEKYINKRYDKTIVDYWLKNTIFYKLSWKRKIDYYKKDNLYSVVIKKIR